MRGGVMEVDERTDVWRERRVEEEEIQGYESGLQARNFNKKHSITMLKIAPHVPLTYFTIRSFNQIIWKNLVNVAFGKL